MPVRGAACTATDQPNGLEREMHLFEEKAIFILDRDSWSDFQLQLTRIIAARIASQAAADEMRQELPKLYP